MNAWRLMILLVLLVSSCRVFPVSPTGSPPTPKYKPTVLPTPTLTQPSPLTLEVWIPDSWMASLDEPTGQVLQEQVRAFESAYPSYRVRLHVKKATGAGGIFDLISTALPVAPSVLPDLVLLDQAGLREGYQKALLSPLEVAPERSADWWAFAQEGATFGGQWYGVPYLVDVEHALVVPKADAPLPLTWDLVLLQGYQVLIPAGAAELADPALVAWYLSTGASLVDERGNPYLERAGLETLYRFVRTLQQGGWLRAAQVRGLADARACWDVFERGQGSLTVVPAGAFWGTGSSRGVPMPLPALEQPPITSVTRLLLWGRVNQDPKRLAATQALLDWLTAPEQVSALSKTAQMLPVSRAALALWELQPDQAATLYTILETGVLMPPSLVDQAVRRALQAGLLELLTSEEVTPEAAATVALTRLRE